MQSHARRVDAGVRVAVLGCLVVVSLAEGDPIWTGFPPSPSRWRRPSAVHVASPARPAPCSPGRRTSRSACSGSFEHVSELFAPMLGVQTPVVQFGDGGREPAD